MSIYSEGKYYSGLGSAILRRVNRKLIPSDIKNLALWYDLTDRSTLFQNSGLTTPVTADGQTIAGVRAKVGPNLNVGALTYKTASTGHPLSLGTAKGAGGASEYLQSTDSAPAMTAFTTFVVFKTSDVATSRNMFNVGGSVSGVGVRVASTGLTNILREGASTYTQSLQAYNTTDWSVTSGDYSGTSGLSYVNGDLDNTKVFTQAIDTNGVVTLLGRSSTLAHFNGWVSEVIMFSRVLAPWEREVVDRYLDKKHGIPARSCYVNTQTGGSGNNQGRLPSDPYNTLLKAASRRSSAYGSGNIYMTTPAGFPDRTEAPLSYDIDLAIRPGPGQPTFEMRASNAYTTGWTLVGSVWNRVIAHAVLPDSAWVENLLTLGEPTILTCNTSTPTTPAAGGYGYVAKVATTVTTGVASATQTVASTTNMVIGESLYFGTTKTTRVVQSITNATTVVLTATITTTTGEAITNSTFYVRMPGSVDPNSYTIEITDRDSCITVSTNLKVVSIYNLLAYGGRRGCVVVGNTARGGVLEAQDCTFAYGYTGGISSRGVISGTYYPSNFTAISCVSHHQRNDGFNIHGGIDTDTDSGFAIITNCIGRDCQDEGISAHNDCAIYVNGGSYYNNRSGGILSIDTVQQYIDGVTCYNNCITDYTGKYAQISFYDSGMIGYVRNSRIYSPASGAANLYPTASTASVTYTNNTFV